MCQQQSYVLTFSTLQLSGKYLASSSSNEYSMFTFLRSSSTKQENQHTDFVSYLRFLMKLIVRRVNAQTVPALISEIRKS